MCFIVGWLYASGMQLLIILPFLFGMFVLYVGIARVIAETGLVYLRGSIMPPSFALFTVGSAAIRPSTMVTFANSFGYFPDAKSLRIMLSLSGLNDFVQSEAHAVVELQDLDNKELVHLVGGEKVETVVAHDVVGRLMIQCARQPGLGMVMESLLGFEGCEFYMQEQPELVCRRTL